LRHFTEQFLIPADPVEGEGPVENCQFESHIKHSF
jgi:hypothetical protein